MLAGERTGGGNQEGRLEYQAGAGGGCRPGESSSGSHIPPAPHTDTPGRSGGEESVCQGLPVGSRVEGAVQRGGLGNSQVEPGVVVATDRP